MLRLTPNLFRGEIAQQSVEMPSLASRAAKGDTAATAELLRELAPKMIRAARALMGADHSDLDDVVQQSMIAFVQALPAFRGECSPGHYASRIVTRVAVAARQRVRLRRTRQDGSLDVDTFSSPEDCSQSDQIVSERRKALVRHLMDCLPQEQAETIALRFALGLPLEDVAKATGVPLNTVRSRLRLAKEAMRRKIDADPTLAEELSL